jgi:hypothetical protein
MEIDLRGRMQGSGSGRHNQNRSTRTSKKARAAVPGATAVDAIVAASHRVAPDPFGGVVTSESQASSRPDAHSLGRQ